MKKEVLISAIIMAFATTGFAQGNIGAGTPDRKTHTTHHALLGQEHIITQNNKMFPNTGYFLAKPQNTSNKPTQMQSRLKNAFNQVYDGTGYQTLDSNIYFYSDLRNQIGADATLFYALGVPFFDVTLYDPNDFRQGLIFDSAQSYNIGGPLSIEYLTFDANGNTIKLLDKVDSGAGYQNVMQIDYTYDAQSKMTSMFNQYWDGNSWLNTTAGHSLLKFL